MNRRQLMILSGAAAAAGQALAQSQAVSGSKTSVTTQRAAAKALLKLSRPKSSYKIPKSDAKKAKLVSSLGVALALTSDQQAQADAIFSSAVTARAALRGNLKTARQNLRDAVKNMDTAAIDRLSGAVGSLKAQLISVGAGANAAFYRTLTPDQQAKLAPLQS